jgi:hypothetical protein
MSSVSLWLRLSFSCSRFNALLVLLCCLEGGFCAPVSATPTATGTPPFITRTASVRLQSAVRQTCLRTVRSIKGGRHSNDWCRDPYTRWQNEKDMNVGDAFDSKTLIDTDSENIFMQHAFESGRTVMCSRNTRGRSSQTNPASNLMKQDEGNRVHEFFTPKAISKGDDVLKLCATPKMPTKDQNKNILSVSSPRSLLFWENMICGAISRSMAQVMMHPMNTMKTIMQADRGTITFKDLAASSNWRTLTRGAGAQFILSVPHGALNFAVLELVLGKMTLLVQRQTSAREGNEKRRGRAPKGIQESRTLGPGLDFISSCISTITCSVVSTPQMMITDNIMAGSYSNLPDAVRGLMSDHGVKGFYKGWWPGLAGKIPSYALTWTFFQQLKKLQLNTMKRSPKDIENSIMGCTAAAATVCIMIPMDTIKTRLVTQAAAAGSTVPYKGIIDAATRITREEGVGAFYRGLSPRLLSVVPMIGIQFGVYEYMKKVMLARTGDTFEVIENRDNDKFVEVTMEVGADDDQPFPAPFFERSDKEEIQPIKN